MSPTMTSKNHHDGDKIGKFDGTHYTLWSYKMRVYLMSKGMWHIVTGTSEVTDIKEREQLETKAYATIVLNLADNQLLHVMNSNSAMEVWSTLEAYHKNTDVANRMHMKEQFASFKYRNGPIQDHITQLEQLVIALRSAGGIVDDEDVCMTLLRSLPLQFEPLIQALKLSVIKWQLPDIINRIIAEDIRKNDFNKSETQSALLSQKKFTGKHKFKRGANKKTVIPPGYVCHICNIPGHFKKDCPSKREDEINVAFVASSQETIDNWVIDSGASCHMCMNRDRFVTYEPMTQDTSISVAKNGVKMKILGRGDIKLRLKNETHNVNVIVKDALHVKGLCKNLLSVPAMTYQGCTVSMNKNKCTIMNKNIVVATGTRNGALYYLDMPQLPEANLSMMTWHQRLGHASISDIKEMNSRSLLGKIDKNDIEMCDVCQISKQTKKPFPIESAKDKDVYRSNDIVCSDVMGPISPPSRSKKVYIVSFVLMKSRYMKIYPMTNKSEVFEMFKTYCNEIKTETGIIIKTIRSDNGGEFKNEKMNQFCKSMNISQQFTIPYNPQQNGMSERMNRTLIETTRCMIEESKMDKTYWLEAMMTATKLRNVISTKTLNYKSPHELVMGRPPKLSHLRIFGTMCYAHIPSEKRKKLDNPGVKCRLLGYADNQLGYRLLRCSDKSIIFSRSVTFNEEAIGRQYNDESPDIQEAENTVDPGKVYIKVEPVSTQANMPRYTEPQPMYDQPDDIEMNEQCNDDENQAQHKSQAQLQEPTMPPPLPESPPISPRVTRSMTQAVVTTKKSFTPGRDGEDESDIRPSRKKRVAVRYQDEFDGLYCLNAMSDEDVIAKDEQASTYNGICESKFKDLWITAMDNEIKSIRSHKTWIIEDIPDHCRSIGCRWIFKAKRKANGDIDRFKARLCAKGFSQIPGVDFNETYAPVAKMTSIRAMLAIAAEKDLEIMQYDIDTAFLYGEIEEIIYMDQPTGYTDPKRPFAKCRLLKSLYGTKQAARQWNTCLHAHLTKQNFTNLNTDHCIYIRASSNEYTVIAVYVDDLIVMSNKEGWINDIVVKLKDDFKIKEIGELKYCLGIEISRNRVKKTLYMKQTGYIEKIAKRFGLQDCKPVSTPADSNTILVKMTEDEEFIDKFPYRELIGSIMYAMIATRPDVANALGNVAKYSGKYNQSHWNATKRILKYMICTKDYGIKFNGNASSTLYGYADANWGADIDTRRSTTGYLFILNGGLISWKSQRQRTVATSSTESEYMALFAATQESIWLRGLLKGFKHLKEGPTMIFQDNQGCIALARNPVYHSRTKHIDIKYHFIRDQLLLKTIDTKYVKTEDMLADILTKDLPRLKFAKNVKMINMNEEDKNNNEGKESILIKGRC